MCITRSHSRRAPAIDLGFADKIAVVLVTHGDRAGPVRNKALLSHTNAIYQRAQFCCVTCGVLKGEPLIGEALQKAVQAGPALILVYPLFMSSGYFVETVLARRIAEGDLPVPVRVLPPIGLSARLPELLWKRSLEVACLAEFSPENTRLLLTGHGSKIGRRSAQATAQVARQLVTFNVFNKVQTAFLEEPPLLHNQLAADRGPTVIAGLFASDGLHAYDDVPAAIEETGANAVYTGAIGTHPEIVDLVLAELSDEGVRLS